jgi:hypothetical protein
MMTETWRIKRLIEVTDGMRDARNLPTNGRSKIETDGRNEVVVGGRAAAVVAIGDVTAFGSICVRWEPLATVVIGALEGIDDESGGRNVGRIGVNAEVNGARQRARMRLVIMLLTVWGDTMGDGDRALG